MKFRVKQVLAFAIPALAESRGHTRGKSDFKHSLRTQADLAATSLDTDPCPALPQDVPLPTVSKLPDPFLTINGSRVSTLSEWECRQQEINALFQRYELGTKPPRPSSFNASLSGITLTINASEDDRSISFAPTITYPTTGTAPYPALIAFDGGSLPIPSGVAVINFAVDDMAQQDSAASRGLGKFYDLYGTNATASAMMAWAWGVSRIVDALDMLGVNETQIDTAHLAVTGCSRNGKGALVAGAFDARIGLTIPQESGSGGSACWRLSDYQLANGQLVQTASEIVDENVWFSVAFDAFSNDTAQLSFDHHTLAGLIAPRGLFVIENTAYEWLGPWSCYGCMRTAHLIWQAVGVPDNMGFSQLGGHLHCEFPEEQQADLDAFVGKFLFGEESNTRVMKTDLNATDVPLNRTMVWDQHAFAVMVKWSK